MSHRIVLGVIKVVSDQGFPHWFFKDVFWLAGLRFED